MKNHLVYLKISPDNPMSVCCDLEYHISERLSQKLLQVTDNVQPRMLSILAQCKIIDYRDITTTYEYAAFIMTDSILYVTKPDYGWLMERLDRNIDVAQTQKLRDLVNIDSIDDTTFAINFLDETIDREEKWECKFETSSCLQNTFATIKTPWEKLFKVPLEN